jgi:DNA invertase Pin-like site-specific DNA recombinase
MDKKKRVWNLYRVSTKSQVNKNEDIPLQENACRKFIREHSDWELCFELYERGISGWKNKTDDRDALVKIKEAAENKEFDVLLVWMFDRLGRREDESPLVVQFLIGNGVEVWSVAEGQAKLEQHSDLLINYIRFWQSSGESKKTSIRVKEKMSQLNEKGLYMGGRPPIGYKLVETDIKHERKDKNIKKLVIDENEKEIVKLIFDLALNKGYGSSRITKYLNEHGYKNKDNKSWGRNSIGRMLRNPVYMGRKRYNIVNDNKKVNSKDEWKLQPFDPELMIISEDDFFKVQEMIEIRNQSDTHGNKKEFEKRNINVPTKSQLLLSGIAKCHCGSPLCVDYQYKKYKRKSDGEVTVSCVPTYRCNNALSFKDHGQKLFGAKTYESQVEKIVIDVISNLNLDSFIDEANKYKEENINKKIIQLNHLKDLVQNKYRQLDKLNDEVANSLLGESKFTPEQLSKAIEKTENDIKTNSEIIESLEKEINTSKFEMSDIEHLKTEFHDWETKYRNADLDSKKMMLSRILNDVTFNTKEISISFKLTVENSLGIINEANNHDNSSMDKRTDSNSHCGINTLQELWLKHLEQQGLRNIEFVIERKIA